MFEAIAAFVALFVFGTAWFWTLALVVFIAVLALSENDHNIFPAFIVAAFIYVMMHANVNLSLFSNPLAVLGWIATYFALGSGWSVVKWFSYIHQRGEEFVKYKLDFITKHNKKVKADQLIGDYRVVLDVAADTEIPPPMKHDFKQYIQESGYMRYSGSYGDVVPNWRNNKERMTTWIVYWPTSFVWTVLNDPIMRLARLIYRQLGGVYDKITQRVFGKFGDMSDFE